MTNRCQLSYAVSQYLDLQYQANIILHKDYMALAAIMSDCRACPQTIMSYSQCTMAAYML
jgi:hypothetical protein